MCNLVFSDAVILHIPIKLSILVIAREVGFTSAFLKRSM
jgi:hypothetical protein